MHSSIHCNCTHQYTHQCTHECTQILSLIEELNEVESRINKDRLSLANRLIYLNKDRPDFWRQKIKFLLYSDFINESLRGLRQELYRML